MHRLQKDNLLCRIPEKSVGNLVTKYVLEVKINLNIVLDPKDSKVHANTYWRTLKLQRVITINQNSWFVREHNYL